MFKVPKRYRKCSLELELKVKKVDEVGITLNSPNYISKRSLLKLDDELINNITGNDGTYNFYVSTTSANPDGSFDLYSEFDITNKELTKSVSAWLAGALLKS